MKSKLMATLGALVLMGLLGGVESSLAAGVEHAVLPLESPTTVGSTVDSQDPYFGMNDFLAEMERVIPDCTTGNIYCEEFPMGSVCKFQTNCRCSGNPPSACVLVHP